MEDFLKQDIFFFVTTVAVLVTLVLVGVFLLYAIGIARKINYIMDKVKSETDIISGELGELRANIRREGMKIAHFTKFFSIFKKSNTRKGK